jgi:hypothetical protein
MKSSYSFGFLQTAALSFSLASTILVTTFGFVRLLFKAERLDYVIA